MINLSAKAVIRMGLFSAVVIFCAAPAARPDDAGTVRKGNELYHQGKYAESLKIYNDGLAKNPDSQVLNFNAGASGYKAGELEQASQSLEKAVVSGDKRLQAKAHYNLGNTRYQLALSLADSDTQKASDLMRGSLENYRRSLDLNPKDLNAKFNFEYVTQELKKLQEKQKQQNQQNQQNQNQDKQNQQNQDKQQQDNKQQDKSQQQDQQKQQQAQQEKEREQQQKQQQEKRKDDASSGQQPQSADEQKPGEMSKEEARMLLDSYRADEHAGLLRDKEQGGVSEPEKDW